MTSKGELIRAILFPKPIHFRFYADLIQVAILFLVFGLGGMIYSTYTWIRNGVRTTQILLTKIALNKKY
jgi:cation-transporting ATPase 13A2